MHVYMFSNDGACVSFGTSQEVFENRMIHLEVGLPKATAILGYQLSVISMVALGGGTDGT
jgi:hypothetical protein